jgi:hypothetical protein
VSLSHEITKKATVGILDIAALRDFLAEVDKASEGRYPESLNPKVRVAFGGGIKSITVTVPGEE